jgi:predicted AlkP superfamily phosphohydrolase/phosphomutase
MAGYTTPGWGVERNARIIRRVVLWWVFLALLLHASVAQAYVGPGAGFAFVTSFFLLLSTILLTLLTLLIWPFRALLQWLARRRRPGEPRIRRAVVIGLDGLDPAITRRLIDEGKLPSFQRVAESGGFGELATTCPAISPVAWSTFATGVDPSRHGIFDFLTRDPRDYSAILSSTEIRPPRRSISLGPLRIPLGRPSFRLLRRGIPFWRTLGEYGIPSCVLRVPVTFPPKRFNGTLLSAMCAPDLLGTQGSYLYYTSDPEAAGGKRGGGKVIEVRVDGDRVETHIPGPPHPLRADGRELRLKLGLRLDRERGEAELRVGGDRVQLRRGRYSDWQELRFRLGPALKLRGICRFLLLDLDPLRLYVTPINIDPAHPAMPIGHPFIFPVYLAKLTGRYSTLGLAEDTGALNDEVIGPEAFLEQARCFHQERERVFFEMLKRYRKGLCACVFDITDRVQHMFIGEDDAGADSVIDDLYIQMDQMLGRVLREVDPKDPSTLLLVLSDHGFAPFERGVNLNSWLLERGLMSLEPGHQTCGEYLEGVDWDRTRAFALGLAGIYLNQKGREARGVVSPEEAPALRAEIREALLELKDDQAEETLINEVFDTHQIYNGPFTDNAPDLIVGYRRGYRASWSTVKGASGAGVVEENSRHWRGDHCIDPRLVPGVLLSNRPLEQRSAHLADIAPTILELFGIPKPGQMSGRSLAASSTGEAAS